MDIKNFCGGQALRIAIGIMILILLLTGSGWAATPISSCTTISASGEYVLNQNLFDRGAPRPNFVCINITSNDVVFDGAGYTIDGVENWNTYGIYVYNSTISLTNITVKNLRLTDWSDGIFLNYSSNSIIINNTAKLNLASGIRLESSNNNTLSNNNANSSNIGIRLYYSSNNTLSGNHANLTNGYGIDLYYSSNNTVSGNYANSNVLYGIYLDSSDNNTLSINTASNNGIFYPGYGIRLDNSSNNTLSGNTVLNNTEAGITLYYSSDNNTLRNNYASNNTHGIYIVDANNNRIYNNFFNNRYDFIQADTNHFNTTRTLGINIMGGPYLGGNFWANPDGTGFSQICADVDKDGFCDSPYVLRMNNNNTDYLPLVSLLPSVPSEIYGTKFNDSNGNGTMDAGESGVSGVEIRLIRMIAPGVEYLADGEITNASGNYNFTGLPRGFYRVEELPGEFVQTFPANGMPHFIDLKEGEIKTGINFGNQLIPPGEIKGINFNDSNANGILDNGETGISGTSICLSLSSRCNTTDSTGNYSFSNVSPGNYMVYEYLSSGYVATTPAMVEVTVNSSEVKLVNFGSHLPVPPPEDISIEQQSGEQNGVPTVFRPSLTVLTISKNLTNISGNVVSVNLTMNWSDGTSRNTGMAEIGNTNIWTVDFDAPFPGGIAQMKFDVDVSPAGQSMNDSIQIGDLIFIDPSGVVKNAYNGSLISGATVILLYEYPPGTNNFIVSPSENQIPADNPLITGTDGRYSWSTIPGTYRVRAERAGYISAESDNVTVPPAVENLNISLIPILPAVRFINGTVKDSLNKTGITDVRVFTNTSNSTKTNESGFYSLSVTSGTYNVTAAFDPTYYPNSTTVSTAFSAVVVQDIEIIEKPTGNISGLVARI